MTFSFDTSQPHAYETSMSYGLSSYDITGKPFENVRAVNMEPIVVIGASTDQVRASRLADYVPKTALGRVLWERRQRIISSGEPLRPAKEILEEFAASRDE